MLLLLSLEPQQRVGLTVTQDDTSMEMDIGDIGGLVAPISDCASPCGDDTECASLAERTEPERAASLENVLPPPRAPPVSAVLMWEPLPALENVLPRTPPVSAVLMWEPPPALENVLPPPRAPPVSAVLMWELPPVVEAVLTAAPEEETSPLTGDLGAVSGRAVGDIGVVAGAGTWRDCQVW